VPFPIGALPTTMVIGRAVVSTMEKVGSGRPDRSVL
jgi:hypothetical protein